jgi:hypothetical protein
MPSEFIDLTIGELDEKESWKRSGGFWEKVYHLSGPVPEGWARAFEEVWAGARYAPKRHARIQNGQLLTICLAEELKGEHMEFLYAAVERTNAAYRTILSKPATES